MLHTVFFHAPHLWTWCLFIFTIAWPSAVAVRPQPQDLQNISIPANTSDIIYTPPLCSPSVTTQNSSSCGGAWHSVELNNTYFVSTTPTSADMVPQMRFSFRAAALYISFSPSSNSRNNITLVTNNTIISAEFNASVGTMAALFLSETETSNITITFLSKEAPLEHLDIGPLILSIPLTIPPNSTSSIIVPPPPAPSPNETLPIISFPTFSATTATTPSPVPPQQGDDGAGHKKLVFLGVSLVLGLGFGLTALLAGAYACWRHRKRRKMWEHSQSKSRASSRMKL